MKNLILRGAFIAGILIFTNNTTKAQEGFSLGVEGTPQFSWLMNKDDMNNSSLSMKTTFNSSFGITGQYGFTKNLGIGLNVLYSFQGQRYSMNDFDYYRKVGYVKVPIMFVYTVEVSPKVLFIGKIGPQFSFLANAKLTDKNGNNIVSDQSSSYAGSNFGGVIHAGFSFKLTEMLLLDATLRYDYDFTDAENSAYKLTINNPVPVLSRAQTVTATAPRAASTYNMTAGLTVGLKYLFK